MLSRRCLLGAAVTLACALGLTVALVTSDSGARAEAARGDMLGTGLTGAGAQAPGMAVPAGARRTSEGDSGDVQRKAPGTGGSPEMDPVRLGRVRGLVSDMDGDPVPEAVVVLRDGSSPWVLRRAVTDDRGEFTLDAVPVGAWRVEHEVRRPPVWERMSGIAGTIEVLENRETWVPVLLEGERRLTGTIRIDLEGFALAGEQGFMVDLDLRAGWDPDTTVARGSIHSFVTPPWEGGPRGAPGEADDDVFRGQDGSGEETEGAPEWVAGAFRFENLRPDRYTLRIALEDNEWVTTRIDGEERRLHLYLEREVDLTQGDVELPLEQLDFWQDFIGAALERE